MEVNQPANQAVLADKQQCRRAKETESKKGEWSDGAIFSLLDAYEMKWNKRNRGNLRVGDWEEVSIAVSSRCNGSKPSKTSTQCKNKIEGMKKRYRLEATDSSTPHPNGPSSWPFFVRMDSLLRSSNKSVIDALPGGLDPGGLGLGLGFSELAHNGYVNQASLHADDEDYSKQASLCHGGVGYAKSRADDDGAATMLCAEDVRQVPFSHLQLLQGNEDLRKHAFFPEEEEQDGDEEDGLQEAESKHVSMSRTVLERKEKSETSAHGYKLATPLPVDAVATGPANEAVRDDRKPCAKQKKNIHNEVLASIRTFAESILKLEHAKMEMFKDAERLRAEAEARRADLELQRTQMIMSTQLEIAKLLASNSSSSIKKNMKKKIKRTKETKAPSKNGVNSMDGEPLQTSLAQVQHVEAIPSSRSASANDFEV